MKLKKGPKIILIISIILVVIAVGVLIFINLKPKTKKVEEVKILNTIEKYNYNLKENKPKKYETLFRELEKILKAKEVDMISYVSKISEMFIVDAATCDGAYHPEEKHTFGMYLNKKCLHNLINFPLDIFLFWYYNSFIICIISSAGRAADS